MTLCNAAENNRKNVNSMKNILQMRLEPKNFACLPESTSMAEKRNVMQSIAEILDLLSSSRLTLVFYILTC